MARKRKTAKKRKGLIIEIAATLLVAALVVLAIGNPSEEKHKNAIYKRAQNAAAEKGFWHSLAAAGAKHLRVLDATPLRYKNYYFFSMLTHGEERVTFGILWHVKITKE